MDIDQIEKLAELYLVQAKKKPWSNMSKKHQKNIWEGMGGSFEDCAKKMKDKVTDTGAFCGSLKRSVKKKKKKKS